MNQSLMTYIAQINNGIRENLVSQRSNCSQSVATHDTLIPWLLERIRIYSSKELEDWYSELSFDMINFLASLRV